MYVKLAGHVWEVLPKAYACEGTAPSRLSASDGIYVTKAFPFIVSIDGDDCDRRDG